jgi:hypothetical protein
MYTQGTLTPPLSFSLFKERNPHPQLGACIHFPIYTSETHSSSLLPSILLLLIHRLNYGLSTTSCVQA